MFLKVPIPLCLYFWLSNQIQLVNNVQKYWSDAIRTADYGIWSRQVDHCATNDDTSYVSPGSL